MSELASESVTEYDVLIVGAGIAGALLAKELARSGKRVLILEAGDAIQPNNSEYLNRYYEATSKVPESPYTPSIFEQAPKDPADPVARLTEGQRSDAPLTDPRSINAGRPTVLSISLRAWQEPEKGRRSESEPRKADWQSELNYYEQVGALPFASTYERIAGGTARHWLGIALRHLPNDFEMGKRYAPFADRHGGQSPWPDWPEGCRYQDLLQWYDRAEQEIGVSGDAATQKAFESSFGFPGAPTHGYPMQAIPLSYGDKILDEELRAKSVAFTGPSGTPVPLQVTPIPSARNSEPFNRRRACAGNSSCIPICPIQAKYDPTLSLREALDTGLVTIVYRAVANNIAIDHPDFGPANTVKGIDFIEYDQGQGGSRRKVTATAKLYVLAANAIETPRLMLMSNDRKGISGNPERPIGRYLMDHPFYIAAATAKERGPDGTEKARPLYPFRGPLVTGGIEALRDGAFREQHAAFRVDVSNTGWSLTHNGSPQTLAEDFITGQNHSGRNPRNETLAGTPLVEELNKELTSQATLGFLIEQTPDRENRVSLSDRVDGLGLPRPRIDYDFSPYTKDGLVQAAWLARSVFEKLGWEPYPDQPPLAPGESPPKDDCSFVWKDPETQRDVTIRYMGAGHIAGTCRMGAVDDDTSVVDSNLRSWDLANLYIVGSSVFPTLGTANPTLTIAALSLRLADHLRAILDGDEQDAKRA
jgi:choline dehydrogenase-like flavoprotein